MASRGEPSYARSTISSRLKVVGSPPYRQRDAGRSTTTATSKGKSARCRVLGTTELLEMILLGLDMKTLLISQRVNKNFKATIEQSTPIQQALFFKPVPEGSSPPHTGRHNTLIVKVDPLTGNRPRLEYEHWKLFSDVCNYHHDPYPNYHRAGLRVPIGGGDEPGTLSFERIVLDPNSPTSSWHRMLLQQPPVDHTVGMTRWPHPPVGHTIGMTRSLYPRSKWDWPHNYRPIYGKKEDTLGDLELKMRREIRVREKVEQEEKMAEEEKREQEEKMVQEEQVEW